MKYIRRVDQFGIPLTLRINQSEKQYKSTFGGVVSLLLYAVSLSYFSYKVYLWQTNQILPKLSTQTESLEYAELTYSDYDPISISIKTGGNIDPFSEVNNILSPYIFYFQNGEFTLVERIVPTKNYMKGYSSLIIPRNIELVLNANGTQGKPEKQAFIVFVKCEQGGDLPCASESESKQFYEQAMNMMYIDIEIKEYNLQTSQVDIITKKMYLAIEEYQTIFAQLMFKFSTTRVNNGIIFDDITESRFINDYDFFTQQLQHRYFENILSMEVVGGFMLRLDSSTTVDLIVNPKIGVILADVGSIISTLLMLKIIVFMVNEWLLEDELLFRIISFYYPELSQLKIHKNIIGKVTSVFRNDHEVRLDEFKTFMIKSKAIAKRKLTSLNQLYEISRLQFILQSIQPHSIMKHSHKIGIKLQLNTTDDLQDNMFSNAQSSVRHSGIKKSKVDKSLLLDSDFQLLCQQKCNTVSELPDDLPTFYCSNEIKK